MRQFRPDIAIVAAVLVVLFVPLIYGLNSARNEVHDRAIEQCKPVDGAPVQTTDGRTVCVKVLT